MLCFFQYEPFCPAQSKLYVSFLCALSRWNKPHNPDVGSTTGEQFRAIKTFLEKNAKTEFVWFDFGCLPQKLKNANDVILQPLNSAEVAYFKKALSVVNLLYMHAKVLILFDADYNHRFWCLYEAFLATHAFNRVTLELEPEGGSWNVPKHLALTTYLFA